MKTIATLVFSLIVLFFMSCEKKSATIISSHVDITVLNQQGQNMLAAPAVYTKSDINIYYVVNGQEQLVDNSNLPTDGDFNYKGFNLIDEGTSRIRIFLNYNRKAPTALTLIKFGTSKIDTIKGEFEFVNNSVFLRKVWFNGVLKSNEFNIIK